MFMIFHVELQEWPLKKIEIEKKNTKKKFHVFPGVNSWNFHGLFWTRNFLDYLSELFSREIALDLE